MVKFAFVHVFFMYACFVYIIELRFKKKYIETQPGFESTTDKKYPTLQKQFSKQFLYFETDITL